MTRRHVESLVNYNKSEHESTKQDILNVIKRVGGPIRPHDIKKFLDVAAYNKLNKAYEEGKLSKHELKSRFQDEQVSLRTIQRHLAELIKERLIVNSGGGNYSLSIKAKSDIRYFAREFGQNALAGMMSNFIPAKVKTSDDIHKNLSSLAQLFGTYVLYCLVEAGRPIDNNSNNTRMMSACNKDNLIKQYLDNVFPIALMYRFFQSIIQYIFNKQMTSVGKQNNSNPSAADILEEFVTRFVKEGKQLTKDSAYFERNQEGKPFYELDSSLIESLDNVLEKIIDPRTYNLLTIRGAVNQLEERLKNTDPKTRIDLSKDLQKWKSDIETNRPKNKAAVS